MRALAIPFVLLLSLLGWASAAPSAMAWFNPRTAAEVVTWGRTLTMAPLLYDRPPFQNSVIAQALLTLQFERTLTTNNPRRLICAAYALAVTRTLRVLRTLAPEAAAAGIAMPPMVSDAEVLAAYTCNPADWGTRATDADIKRLTLARKASVLIPPFI